MSFYPKPSTCYTHAVSTGIIGRSINLHGGSIDFMTVHRYFPDPLISSFINIYLSFNIYTYAIDVIQYTYALFNIYIYMHLNLKLFIFLRRYTLRFTSRSKGTRITIKRMMWVLAKFSIGTPLADALDPLLPNVGHRFF
jgi:hypothetical protein